MSENVEHPLIGKTFHRARETRSRFLLGGLGELGANLQPKAFTNE
jgi:hypothetical protein